MSVDFDGKVGLAAGFEEGPKKELFQICPMLNYDR